MTGPHCSCPCPIPCPCTCPCSSSSSSSESSPQAAEGGAGVRATSPMICCRALISPSAAPSPPPPSPSILPLSSTMSYLAFSSSHLNPPSSVLLPPLSPLTPLTPLALTTPSTTPPHLLSKALRPWRSSWSLRRAPRSRPLRTLRPRNTR
ncbi:hypothetical protein B484DRAFT_232298 [Ochromonadaceae sp. CCMP2298]|nr:hypothetical protein B484DRAFT_232298 [Ochromonadaceae sp. CCMP2298]